MSEFVPHFSGRPPQQESNEYLVNSLAIHSCSSNFHGAHTFHRTPASQHLSLPSNMTNSTTTTPAENDIVCGRGKGFDLLPANQTFRRIIAENAARYSGFRKSRTEKSILIRLIAHQLKMDNMRFVRRTKHGWKALLEHEVNLKVRSERNEWAIDFNNSKRPINFSDWSRTQRCGPAATKVTEESMYENPAPKQRQAWFS